MLVKVFRTLEWIIFSLLVITGIIIFSPILPTKNHIYTYIVTTGSMENTIMTGSIAFVKPAQIITLKKGDIITFTSPKDSKQIILHRIFTITQQNKTKQFLTKGDNNNAPDNWIVNSSHVKGYYLFSIPYIGFLSTLVKTPKGFFILIVIPACILAFLQIRAIKQGIEEEVEKRINKFKTKTKKRKTIKNMILLIVFFNIAYLLGSHNSVQAMYTSTAVISGTSFSVINYNKPSKPDGLRYINPDIACGGATNNSLITAKWNDSPELIDHYEYQLFNQTSDVITVHSSEYSSSLSNGEGVYGFRVRAIDNFGYKSDWSSIDFAGSCQISFDTTKPTSIITTGLNINNDNEALKLHAHFTNAFDWNGTITGTTYDEHSGVNAVQISIYRPFINKYWNGSAWVNGTEENTRVLSSLTLPSWGYQLSNHPTGTYIIKSHAVDQASNIENTYTLTLENEEEEIQINEPTIDLTFSSDNKTISFIVSSLNHAKLSYVLSYDAYNSAKGIIGSDIDVTGLMEYKKDAIDLATCSGTVCTYDQNISNIKLIVTLTDKNDSEIKLEKAL